MLNSVKSLHWTIRVFVVGLVAIVGQLLIVAQQTEAADPSLLHSKFLVREYADSGTTGISNATLFIPGENMTELSGAATVDGADSTDVTVAIIRRLDRGFNLSLAMGDKICPTITSCSFTITLTNADSSVTKTVDVVRLDGNVNIAPTTSNFSLTSTTTATTATLTLSDATSTPPPIPVSSGLYYVTWAVPGDFANEWRMSPRLTTVNGSTMSASLTGLSPETTYSPTDTVHGEIQLAVSAWELSAPGPPAGEVTGVNFPQSFATQALPSRTITLNPQSSPANQSITPIEATVDNGAGAISYALDLANSTSTSCELGGGLLRVTSPGTCAVTATVASDGTWASATTTAVFTFTAVDRTLSFTGSTTGADQSVTLTATKSIGSGTVTYTVVNGTATGCSVSGTTLTTGTPGTCVVTASVPAEGVYDSATTDATFTFTGLTRTLTLADGSSAADQSVTLAATVSAGGGTTTYTVANGTATGCSVSGTTLTVGTPGTCVVTASVPAAGSYLSATDDATFTFTEVARTLTFAGGSSAANQSVTLAATVSAGSGAVTYTVANGSATGCSVSGTTLTVGTPGTCVVTASVPAAGAYSAATKEATFTFTAVASETSTTTTTTTTTTVPVASPTTTTIAPDRDNAGTLLELEPGASGSIVNGRVEVVDIRTVGTAVELFSDEFSLNIGAKASNSEAITPTADGRLVVAEDATVLVSGEGFEPGSQVEVWLFSDPQLLGVAEVASDGTFSATFALPAAVEIGAHTLQADGRTADGSTRTLNLGIEVVEDDPREADGLTMKGPDGTFYELEPETAALLTDDDDDGLASVRDANYSVTDGEISVTTDSDLSLLIATSTASSVTTTTQGSASIIFEQGSELIARGTGYEPGVKVEVWVASTPRLLGIAVVGSNGEYELRIPVPTDLPVGSHTIQSEGLASDGIPKAVSVGITVRSQPDAVALPQTGGDANLELALLVLTLGALIGIVRRRAFSTD